MSSNPLSEIFKKREKIKSETKRSFPLSWYLRQDESRGQRKEARGKRKFPIRMKKRNKITEEHLLRENMEMNVEMLK